MPTGQAAKDTADFLDYVRRNFNIPDGLEASVLVIRHVIFSVGDRKKREGLVIAYELPRGSDWGEFRTVLEDVSMPLLYRSILYRSINPTACYNTPDERETAKQRFLESLDRKLEEQGFF